jgi:hypothetical protein
MSPESTTFKREKAEWIQETKKIVGVAGIKTKKKKLQKGDRSITRA